VFIQNIQAGNTGITARKPGAGCLSSNIVTMYW